MGSGLERDVAVFNGVQINSVGNPLPFERSQMADQTDHQVNGASAGGRIVRIAGPASMNSFRDVF